MSDLPSREEINERIGGLGTGKLTGAWAVAGAYGLGELKTKTEWREAMTQIGWFDPGSKRFCYSDEKEYDPERRTFYTEPAFVVDAAIETPNELLRHH